MSFLSHLWLKVALPHLRSKSWQTSHPVWRSPPLYLRWRWNPPQYPRGRESPPQYPRGRESPQYTPGKSLPDQIPLTLWGKAGIYVSDINTIQGLIVESFPGLHWLQSWITSVMEGEGLAMCVTSSRQTVITWERGGEIVMHHFPAVLNTHFAWWHHCAITVHHACNHDDIIVHHCAVVRLTMMTSLCITLLYYV